MAIASVKVVSSRQSHLRRARMHTHLDPSCYRVAFFISSRNTNWDSTGISVEAEIDANFHMHRNWFTVEQCRLVRPRMYRGHSRR